MTSSGRHLAAALAALASTVGAAGIVTASTWGQVRWWSLGFALVAAILGGLGIAGRVVRAFGPATVSAAVATTVAARGAWSPPRASTAIDRLTGAGDTGWLPIAGWALLLAATVTFVLLALTSRSDRRTVDRARPLVAAAGTAGIVAVSVAFGAIWSGRTSDSARATVWQRTGAAVARTADLTNPAGLRVAWTRPVINGSTATAVPGWGVVLVQDDPHLGRARRIRALRSRDGSPAWTLTMPEGIDAVAIEPASGRLLIVSGDVSAVLDLASGRPLARLPLPNSSAAGRWSPADQAVTSSGPVVLFQEDVRAPILAQAGGVGSAIAIDIAAARIIWRAAPSDTACSYDAASTPDGRTAVVQFGSSCAGGLRAFLLAGDGTTTRLPLPRAASTTESAFVVTTVHPVRVVVVASPRADGAASTVTAFGPGPRLAWTEAVGRLNTVAERPLVIPDIAAGLDAVQLPILFSRTDPMYAATDGAQMMPPLGSRSVWRAVAVGSSSALVDTHGSPRVERPGAAPVALPCNPADLSAGGGVLAVTCSEGRVVALRSDGS